MKIEDNPVFQPNYMRNIIYNVIQTIVNGMTKMFMFHTKGHYSDDWLDGYRTAIEELTDIAQSVQKEDGNERNDIAGHGEVCQSDNKSGQTENSD